MRVKLGELTSIKTGKLDANASSAEGQYPFFTCSKEPLRISTYSYDCECVVVAGNGDLNVKYYNGKFDAYQRTYIIEDDSNGKLYMPYLYFFMERYVEELRAQAIGGVIKYIKLGNLTEAIIELPSIDRQKRMVRILNESKEIISKRENQIKKYDDLIRARFVEMFGDPESNPMHWRQAPLQQLLIVEPQNGLYKPQSDYVEDGKGTPILRIDAFYDGKVTDFKTLKRLNCSEAEKQRYLLYEDDIVINRVNSIEYLGKCAHITGMIEDTVFESNMMRFHFDDNIIDAEYATYLLCSQYIYNQILRRAKKAVNQASINQGDVQSFTMLVPPLAIQKKFSEFVTQIGKSKLMEEKLWPKKACFSS